MLEIRLANIHDAAGVLDIYAPFVLTEATTFETEVPSIEEIQKRISTYSAKYPWIVCYHNKTMGGYAYASTFKEREAYQWSCESSIYMHPDYRGKGIARKLYELLFQLLKEQGIRNVYAGITLPNIASVKMHEHFGFEKIALYENVGYKLGAWRNVGWWRLQLNDYSPEPAPPIWFQHLKRVMVEENLSKAAQQLSALY